MTKKNKFLHIKINWDKFKFGFVNDIYYLLYSQKCIIKYGIFNTAKSAKFIGKYGYLYINNEGSFSKRQKDETQNTRTLLYLLDTLIDFSLDLTKNKKVLVHFIIFLFQREYLKGVVNNEYDYKILISCLDRILNCKYISDELKNEIRIRGKNLRFIKYKF